MSRLIPGFFRINEVIEGVALLAQAISSNSLQQKEAKSLNISAKISDNEFRTTLDEVLENLEKREEQKYEMKNKEIEKKDKQLLQEKKKRISSIKERMDIKGLIISRKETIC